MGRVQVWVRVSTDANTIRCEVTNQVGSHNHSLYSGVQFSSGMVNSLSFAGHIRDYLGIPGPVHALNNFLG